MTEFTPLSSTLGGVVIGLASVAMLSFNGRIAGISGIVGGLMTPGARDDRSWRIAFVGGLMIAGLILSVATPDVFGGGSPRSWPWLALAGLTVGLGTRIGSGCTSGHGVCGLSRLSVRSLVATAIFMSTAAATVYWTRHLAG
ncbi:MAG: YeeE/YedE family protein [Myxococcota bacterium]